MVLRRIMPVCMLFAVGLLAGCSQRTGIEGWCDVEVDRSRTGDENRRPDVKPLSFAPIRVFAADGRKIVDTKADGDGCFQIRLLPGKYRVAVDGSPHRKVHEQEVTVTEKEFTHVKFRFHDRQN